MSNVSYSLRRGSGSRIVKRIAFSLANGEYPGISGVNVHQNAPLFNAGTRSYQYGFKLYEKGAGRSIEAVLTEISQNHPAPHRAAIWIKTATLGGCRKIYIRV